MFVGSLAFVTILYLLQRLNDREHALDYVYPYVLLVAVSAFDLALRFNSAWLVLVIAARGRQELAVKGASRSGRIPWRRF